MRQVTISFGSIQGCLGSLILTGEGIKMRQVKMLFGSIQGCLGSLILAGVGD